MDELNPKKNTESAYLSAFKLYTDYTGMTPLELLTEAENDIKSGILPRERAIKRHLSGFRKHLQSKEYAPISIRNIIGGVTSFYRCYDIDIPHTWIFENEGLKVLRLSRHHNLYIQMETNFNYRENGGEL
ncbi:hypothetical protein V7O66_03695 [Methanolobus sp. ZRKC3]|uniref:hypothetical protein n=1 Tax=Methanolobus sp. ZRKC3 TaxID=3125786 RepID=UPI00324DB17A